jgi:hypothetical protein
VLAAVAAVGLLFPVLFYAWVYRLTGFGLQGRYVLPVLMAAPLVAGELVSRRFGGRAWSHRMRLIVAAAIVILAAVQLIAWWVNARHWSGAPHAVVFQDSRGWAPPLGWWTWTTAVAASLVLLAGLALTRVLRREL